jgi:hypothetical protein
MRALWLWLVLVGCGAPPVAAPITVDIDATALPTGAVSSVEVLALSGDAIDCARVLSPEAPLDDSGLTLVAHALITAEASDSSGARLSNLPVGASLVFYGESYGTAMPRMRNGRGCAPLVVEPGAEVTIVLTP